MRTLTAKPMTQRFTLLELVLLVLVCVVIVGLVGPMVTIHPHREKARRVICAGNLKQIGVGARMYAGDHDHHFPNPLPNTPPHNNFAVLTSQNYILDGKVWACPSRSVVLTSAHTSAYRYIGSGITDNIEDAPIVSLAYDEQGNHPSNEWMNALFVDGHIEGGKPGQTKRNLYFQNN